MVSRAKIITTIVSAICLHRIMFFPPKRAFLSHLLLKCGTNHLRYSPDCRGQREKKMVIRRRDGNSLRTKALVITFL